MKEKTITCLNSTCNEINSSNFYGSRDVRSIASCVKLFSCVNERKAKELFDQIDDMIRPDWDIIPLSYYLQAAKDLEYTKGDMEEYIEVLESQKNRGVWSDTQIWLNSLVVKTLGKYGISYPNMTDYFLEKRLSNGSWYSKVWVSSYVLQGLFYSHAEPDELSLTADYIKNAIDGDHWGKERTERGWIEKEKVTSLALESLLLIGEGYEEKPIRSSLDWVIEQINEREDEKKIATLAVPLTYIAKGRAQKKTQYNKSEPIHFRETKVEIGEQIKGHKVNGDLVNGDKVDEKVGEGATQMKDSVAVRSDVGDGEEGGAHMDNSVAVRSDIGGGEEELEDSIIRRVEKSGGDKDMTFKYSVFTGEQIDGEVKYCPKCGTKVESEWKCCVECGYKMEDIRRLFG